MWILGIALSLFIADLAETAMAKQPRVCRYNAEELFRTDAEGKFLEIHSSSPSNDRQQRSAFWREFEAHLTKLRDLELPRCYGMIKSKYDLYEKGAKDCAKALNASKPNQPRNFTDALKKSCRNQEIVRTNFVDLRIRADNEIARRISPKGRQPASKATYQIFCNPKVKAFYTNFLITRCSALEKASNRSKAR